MRTFNTTKFDPKCVAAVLRRVLKHEEMNVLYRLPANLHIARRQASIEVNWKSEKNMYIWLPDDATVIGLAAQIWWAAKRGTSWNSRKASVRDHAAVVATMAEWLGPSYSLDKLAPKPKPSKTIELGRRLAVVERRIKEWTSAQKAATNKVTKYTKEATKIRKRIEGSVI